jgi:hypothetical protein
MSKSPAGLSINKIQDSKFKTQAARFKTQDTIPTWLPLSPAGVAAAFGDLRNIEERFGSERKSGDASGESRKNFFVTFEAGMLLKTNGTAIHQARLSG